MASSTAAARPTWHGVRFFVSADVLLTFSSVKLSEMAGVPGQPQRRITVIDGKAVPVMSYPTASFFLKTLKATGNSVVVVAPWKQEQTASLLRLFGWDAVDDIRVVFPEPGQEAFRLSCLGCTLEEYRIAVVVTTSRTLWHTALWSQVVEVTHELSCPSRSLALLRALSSCLRIAECRVRFPSTAVSSCVALCRARLFSQYRFCLSPEVMDQSSTAMLINAHGGYLVTNCADATHYVVGEGNSALSCTLQRPGLSHQDVEKDASSVSESSSASSSSSLELVEVEREGDGSWNSSFKDDDDDAEVWDDDNSNDYNAGDNNQALNDVMPSSVATTQATTIAGVLDDPVSSLSALSTVNGHREAGETGEAASAATSTSSTTTTATAASTVTVQWLQDCIEGLLVYPHQVAHSSNGSSQWNISTLLLAALIPPPDVEPISLSSLNNIAEGLGFRPLLLPQTEGEVNLATVLQKQWGAMLHVKVHSEELFLRQSATPPNEGGLEMERHLACIAKQFCDAWTIAIRNSRLRNMAESGTQTAAVLTATSETNTDAVLVNAEEPSVDPPAQGRALLMRALGPAEWAKEVDASHVAPKELRVTEKPVSLEPFTTLALVNEPPTGYDTPPEDKEVPTSDDEKIPTAFAQRASETEAEVPAVDLKSQPQSDEREFVMCFIPTEALGDEQNALKVELLLRQPPFRNYPMKLTIGRKGIHCLFVTTFDAKRFHQEGYAEVRNRFLPILPEYGEGSYSSSDTRKRRRSRSPVSKRSTSSSSRGTRKHSLSYTPDSQSHRSASGVEKHTDKISDSTELSKGDLELLGEIGATLEFACQHVDVVERYAVNELADPVFRKQQHQLLRVVDKLKKMR
ncbi:repressor activator protein 1 [Trypanosoma rangeli]|uniref:Repressor activator protein 1 n=1 Tax=Trypanosoma rangeli TaxID=5698 RepID=A0A422NBZ0_TRYRA|nr:repressor activator protein 1 [Trypanosoma rangeli]RNF02993.1 repressor activator protein 1 [Trypanosoma rangeli]|eukprot:RNF02993.1 repressor activator protein 1 [Trypanosoma rangeli]